MYLFTYFNILFNFAFTKNSCHVISDNQQSHVTGNEEVRSEGKDHGKSVSVTSAFSVSFRVVIMSHTGSVLCLNLLLFLHVVAHFRNNAQQQWPVPYR